MNEKYEHILDVITPRLNMVILTSYLRKVYTDLLIRSSNTMDGLQVFAFHSYIQQPLIVAEKIFQALSFSSTGKLQEKEFIQGLAIIYNGKISQRLNVICRIFDFDLDGKIQKEDVRILLDHMSVKNRRNDITRLNEIIEAGFPSGNDITYAEFQEFISRSNSDVFLLFLLLLMQYQPFTSSQVEFYGNTHVKNFKSSYDDDDEGIQEDFIFSIAEPTESALAYFALNDKESETQITNKEIVAYHIKNTTEKAKLCRLVLHGNNIFYMKLNNNSTSWTLRRIIVLTSTFAKTYEPVEINDQMFFPFQLICNLSGLSDKIIFMGSTKSDVEDFVLELRKITKFRKIKHRYSIGHKIGKGQFGIVRIGQNLATGEIVAIKTLRISDYSPKNFQMLKQEVDICRFLNSKSHPGIVQCLDIYESFNHIHLVFEYVSDISLLTYQKMKNNHFTYEEVTSFSLQVVDSLAFLHAFGIIHRDLKTDNLLLYEEDHKMKVKLIDFGLSKVIGPHEKTCDPYGSILFASPEVLSKTCYTCRTDTWSFGVLLYYLQYGAYPFDDKENNVHKIKSAIYKCNYLNQINSGLNEKATYQVIVQCLCKEEEGRPEINKIAEKLRLITAIDTVDR